MADIFKAFMTKTWTFKPTGRMRRNTYGFTTHEDKKYVDIPQSDDKWWMRAAVIERLDNEKRKQCINSWCAFHFKNRDFVERVRRECYRA